MGNSVSALKQSGESIFAVMSGLARKCDAINLSQGFPGFDIDPDLSALVYKYMREGKNQYAPMTGVPELRQAIARKMKTTLDVDVDPDEEITITAGATQALFNIFMALVNPDDEVIIIEPAYDSYAPAIRRAGGKVVPLITRAPEYQIDWEEVANKINDRTSMIVINTPHNPTGQIIPRNELELLGEVAEKNDLLVLSDEVYEHIVFDDKKHTSVMQIPSLRHRSLATYSFGKTFHATGWKMGYCVGSPELTRHVRNIHQFNVFSVNTPIQYALAEYLSKPERYESLSSFYQERRDKFESLMSDSPFKALPCHGTYFALYDYSDISDKDNFDMAVWLTEKHKVASIPVSSFYTRPPGDTVLRFCFAKNEEELEEAAGRLCDVSVSGKR